jgi:hypothetical protein
MLVIRQTSGRIRVVFDVAMTEKSVINTLMSAFVVQVIGTCRAVLIFHTVSIVFSLYSF